MFLGNASPPTQNSNQAGGQEHGERISRSIGQRDIAQLDRTRDLSLVQRRTPARGRAPRLENAELLVLLIPCFPVTIGDHYQKEKLRNPDLWNSLLHCGNVDMCIHFSSSFVHTSTLEVFYMVCHLRDVYKNEERDESDESKFYII